MEIKHALVEELSEQDAPDLQISRPVPRQLRHFPTETKVSFSADERNHRTVMRLVTLDRPGLLAEVGAVFDACGIRLQNAKIATVGAEADDVFFITTADDTPVIAKNALECLRAEIHRRLEDTSST
jgi:[protein-PII] uridylyltransferase